MIASGKHNEPKGYAWTPCNFTKYGSPSRQQARLHIFIELKQDREKRDSALIEMSEALNYPRVAGVAQW